MSIARQFLREFRPFFQMLEEPFGRAGAPYALPHRSLFDDPFFHSPFGGNGAGLRPAVDVTEEGNNYVLEADLPGVKKENVDVRIGDGGRSVTIEGKSYSRRGDAEAQNASDVSASASSTANAESTNGNSEAITQTEQPSNKLTNERFWTDSSTFTRTVWLPRPVDPAGVSAKLTDGILTLTIPKKENGESVKINVE